MLVGASCKRDQSPPPLADIAEGEATDANVEPADLPALLERFGSAVNGDLGQPFEQL